MTPGWEELLDKVTGYLTTHADAKGNIADGLLDELRLLRAQASSKDRPVGCTCSSPLLCPVHGKRAEAPEPQGEVITAAAIQRTTTGRSHAECFHEAAKLPLGVNYVQGFVTSTGRFVDRKEALKIATESGQFKGPKRYRPFDMLMSEDLWDPQPEAQPAVEPKAGHAFVPAPKNHGSWCKDQCHYRTREGSQLVRCDRPRSEHPEGR